MDKEDYVKRVKEFLYDCFAIELEEIDDGRDCISFKNPDKYFVVASWGSGLNAHFVDKCGLESEALEKYQNSYDDSFDMTILDVERNVEVSILPKTWIIGDC